MSIEEYKNIIKLQQEIINKLITNDSKNKTSIENDIHMYDSFEHYNISGYMRDRSIIINYCGEIYTIYDNIKPFHKIFKYNFETRHEECIVYYISFEQDLVEDIHMSQFNGHDIIYTIYHSKVCTYVLNKDDNYIRAYKIQHIDYTNLYFNSVLFKYVDSINIKYNFIKLHSLKELYYTNFIGFRICDSRNYLLIVGVDNERHKEYYNKSYLVNKNNVSKQNWISIDILATFICNDDKYLIIIDDIKAYVYDVNNIVDKYSYIKCFDIDDMHKNNYNNSYVIYHNYLISTVYDKCVLYIDFINDDEWTCVNTKNIVKIIQLQVGFAIHIYKHFSNVYQLYK